MNLPEGVLAYCLLKSVNLTLDQAQLAKATVTDITYRPMCDKLKSFFGNTSSNKQLGNIQAAIKSEPIDIKQESCYSDQATNYGPEYTYYWSGYESRGHGRANESGGGRRAAWRRSQREGQGRNYYAKTSNLLHSH